jgi:hypothetical protein
MSQIKVDAIGAAAAQAGLDLLADVPRGQALVVRGVPTALRTFVVSMTRRAPRGWPSTCRSTPPGAAAV